MFLYLLKAVTIAPNMAQEKNVILTGLRANGDLHLGSYLGAVLPMAQRQKALGPEDHLYMFVPNLHSFTTPIDHSTLYENSMNNVAMFIAAGVDPDHEQTTLFRQSHISAHSELTIILNNFTYFGEASRMTEFKDKSQKLGNKAISMGLFDYPILMIADILLYSTNYVPLGDDQKQHMELCRTLAQRLNDQFGEDIFTVPHSWEKQLEFTKRDVSVRIKSLAHPETKMSKSVSDPRGTINLNEDPELAVKKVMSAATDSVGQINLDFENQPGISNLLQIAALLQGESVHDYAKKWIGQEQYGPLKSEVAERVHTFLTKFQEAYKQISHEDIEKILQKGEEEAERVSQAKLAQVHQALGLSS